MVRNLQFGHTLYSGQCIADRTIYSIDNNDETGAKNESLKIIVSVHDS